MDETREIGYSQRGRELLEQLETHQITQEEFLNQCAVWALEPVPWGEIVVKNYPIPPPEWQEYENLTPVEKLKLKPEFFMQLPIKMYVDQRSYTRNWNQGQYDRLKDLKKWLYDNEDNVYKHQAIDAKMLEFEHWLNGSVPALEMFGGHVV